MKKETLRDSYQTHQRWLSVINIIKSLNELCFELRAHRGSSTAQLIGDSIFKPLTEQKSNRIAQMLVGFDEYAVVIETLKLKMEFNAITHKWLQIQRQWSHQAALENFNQHSELLNDINEVIWKLAISADPSIKHHGDNDKAQLCYFLLKAHTQALESIARLRGISSYLCAKDVLVDEDRNLISLEIKRTFNNWNFRLDAFQNLPYRFQKLLDKIVADKKLTSYLIELIEMVSSIQNPSLALPNSSEVFNSANHILDALQIQYSQGLDQLTTFLPEELDAWIVGKSTPKFQMSAGLATSPLLSS